MSARFRAAACALDARVKLAAAIAFLCVALAGRAPAAPLVASCAIGLLFALGEARHRLLHVARSVVLFAAAALVIALLARKDLRAAAALSAGLGLRVLAGLSVFNAMIATATPASLGGAMRSLQVPEELAQVIVLAQRYVSVLAGAARTSREAQLVRGGYEGWARGARSAGDLGGLTLLRAFSQAEATHDAIEARGGWPGLLAAPPPWRRTDTRVLLSAGCAAGLVLLLAQVLA